jgi:hypothetical protein
MRALASASEYLPSDRKGAEKTGGELSRYLVIMMLQPSTNSKTTKIDGVKLSRESIMTCKVGVRKTPHRAENLKKGDQIWVIKLF